MIENIKIINLKYYEKSNSGIKTLKLHIRVFTSVDFPFILDPVPAPDPTKIRPEPDLSRKGRIVAGTGYPIR